MKKQMVAIEALNMKKDCWYMMAHALLQAMSPEPAAMMQPPEVQDDPSSSSPSQPQENAFQSPVAVQAGTSSGPGTRYMPLVLAFALSPAFSQIRLCSYCTSCMATVDRFYHPLQSTCTFVWPHAHPQVKMTFFDMQEAPTLISQHYVSNQC